MNEKYNYKFSNFCSDNNIDIEFLDLYLDYSHKKRKWIFMDENSDFPAVKIKLQILKHYSNYLGNEDACDYIENNFFLFEKELVEFDKKRKEEVFKISRNDFYQFYDWCKRKRHNKLETKIISGVFLIIFIFYGLFYSEFLLSAAALVILFFLFFSEIIKYFQKKNIKIKMKNIAKAVNNLKTDNGIPAIELQRILNKKIETENNRTLKGEIEYSKDGNPIILGEEIDKKNFPNLYNWAQSNPGTLIEQVRSIADKWHEGSYSSAMIALETDLSHQ